MPKGLALAGPPVGATLDHMGVAAAPDESKPLAFVSLQKSGAAWARNWRTKRVFATGLYVATLPRGGGAPGAPSGRSCVHRCVPGGSPLAPSSTHTALEMPEQPFPPKATSRLLAGS